ncbi:TonB-dependent siderophore receptor [Acinetobacter nectaris]|uniref:TonB-dependent siderophore receptor n=1 Tax=Acinetobacter nectaris TaxID=1219382 RepID=UPI001F2D3B19|nr:TonB-dependent receptor [Acinetobacter nectaris]MCF9045832.1 TonB-dependent receptor [Acinetobacter nectaris]
MAKHLLYICIVSSIYNTAYAENQVLPTISIQSQSNTQTYSSHQSSTATRTNTSIQDTPQEVIVINKNILNDIQATRLSDGLDIAGIGRGNNFGGQGLTTYTVRGFTSGEYFKNGFPINRGYPNSPDSNTIERIDIIKGPAATLYGRTDPGGTLNIVSKTPKNKQSTELGALIDSEGLFRSTLDTTGPLSQTFSYRLNAMSETGDTYRDGVKTKRWDISPVLQWQPSDQTKVILEADFLRNQHPLDRGFTRYSGQSKTSFDPSTYWWESGKDRNNLTNSNDMIQLRLEQALSPNWKLNVGGQYLKGDLAGYAVEAYGLKPNTNGNVITRNYNWRHLSWEDKDFQANFTGQFDLFNMQHTLIAGIELEEYDYRSLIIRSPKTANFDLNINQPTLGQTLPALTNITTRDHEKLRSQAYFIQDQIALSSQLKTLLGLRYETYKDKYTDFLTSSSWMANEDAFIPRLGFIYTPNDDLSIYTSASKSFKPNTGADRFGKGFTPETGVSYEIGSKWQIIPNRLNMDATVYYTKKNNVLTLDPVDTTKSIAAGKVSSKGIDLNITGQITDAFKIIGNYAYVDASVVKDNTLKKGTRLANIPKNSLNILAMYDIQSGQLDGLSLGINQHFIDRRKGLTSNTSYDMPAYATTDLVATYKASENLKFSLNIRNIFDKNYDSSAFNMYVYPGQGRNAQLGVTYKF